jgi:benzylsuccinate CoA-transferase BbsF subunit
MAKKRPFEDVHIINLAWSGVGNFIVRWFAQYGAMTIRVESANRSDPIRSAQPYAPTYTPGEPPGLERGFLFSQGHPFREYGLALDFNKPKAIELFKKLVPWADVVVETFSPGQMKKWGLAYDDLKEIKPDIIMLSSSGYGQTGPISRLAAFGFQLSAVAGMYEITGWPDRPSVPIGSYYTDVLSPMAGAVAIATALDYRRRTGQGQHIDHCHTESAINYIAPLILDYDANQRLLERNGNKLPYAAPHGVYRCKGDDRWVAIAVFTDEEWESFCRVIGNPDWTRDARFGTLGDRVRNSDELDALVNEWTVRFTAEQVMERLQAAGVAAGLVADGKDLAEDPQLNYYGYFQERDHPYVGRHRHYHPPTFTLSEADPEVTAPVLIGEHTEYIATKILGLSDEEFVQLLQEGVFE